ncbi:MAG: roadblock/LC7 domain-containing protein [Candidatus Heimdallarchaeota archaeon]
MAATDVASLSVLISSLVDLGAKICVLSDINGLPIVTRSRIETEDAEIALSALSSLVVSTGDTIARELDGSFVNMTVRTSGGLLLSSVIDADPKVMLTAIVDENLETTIIHEMQRLHPIISNAIEGIAIEIKEREKLQRPDERKINAFFESFTDKIEQANQPAILAGIIRAQKENLFTLVNSGTISYEMNRFALKLEKLVRNKQIDPESVLNIKQAIKMAINDWKKRLMPE